ncbi:MAG: cupin domain-containing protein [Acidobacteriota bacterium]|nr:cupin domain-containing protein [Acidobacteriota bacterium]
MPNINRRSLLYLMGIASVTPLLAQTGKNGNVVFAQPGESRFPFSTAEQARLSPCKLTGEDSAGACSAFELSEWYYVLSGKFLFKAGGVEHILPAGGSIWLPRGTPHVWTNLSEVEAKLILVCFPGGFEKFFEEMGAAMAKVEPGSPSASKKMAEVFAKYGMEMLGPPLLKPMRPQH